MRNTITMTAEERKEITDFMWDSGLEYGSFKTLEDYEDCIEAFCVFKDKVKHKVVLMTDKEIEDIACNLGNDGDSGISMVNPFFKKGFISGMKLMRTLT